MNRARKYTWSQLRVGILVLIALALMAVFIIQKSWDIGPRGDVFRAKTYLPTAAGLKPGAPVWLAGIEVGRVREVRTVPFEAYAGNKDILRAIEDKRAQIHSIDPASPNAAERVQELEEDIDDLRSRLKIVEVTLEVDQEYFDRVSADSDVRIEQRGLISESFMEISPGSYGTPPRKMDEKTYLLEGKGPVGFREIITGVDDVVANFTVLSSRLKNVATQIDEEKLGESVSDLVSDLKTTVRKSGTTFTEAADLMHRLKQGEGSFAKFVSEPAVYNNLKESLTSLNELTDKANRGDGTLSKFINDPGVYNRVDRSLKSFETITGRMERGEGTLGKLSQDEEFYNRTRDTLEKFTALMDRIDRGEGTMGKLLRDPQLYDNLNTVSSEVVKFLYDFRKNPKKYLTIKFELF
ncbi:MAG: MCE family protein [Acidobacteria bacterium]|nr:MCE family protein [Acidobacteriota bacterium]